MKPQPPLPAVLAAALLAAAALSACQADQKYSQTQLAALQTREFDAGFDATFNATVDALFDAGYVIRSSDKRGGFVSAGRTSGNSWSGYAFGAVQIKVESAGPRRTSVRISTTDGSQQHVDTKAINELMVLIEQRLLATTPPPPVAAPK